MTKGLFPMPSRSYRKKLMGTGDGAPAGTAPVAGEAPGPADPGLPSVYLIRGNDYTTEADMVGTEEQSYDITKNAWTPVGESADEQAREWTLTGAAHLQVAPCRALEQAEAKTSQHSASYYSPVYDLEVIQLSVMQALLAFPMTPGIRGGGRMIRE
ncbi:hypothetical protein QFZ22_004972 [Streptomyces canus]|uniref:Uncharacterized protein n=1 Tax=Streptomyces canus TaxID=58343 RepID=A0AAW8FFS9_9ACTN|nr:hypothetical protein [Streptomyces canus]MDQ0908987.1 hypothetical protein [Streptomyces canus]